MRPRASRCVLRLRLGADKKPGKEGRIRLPHTPPSGIEPVTMYLPIGSKSRIGKRNKTARRNAKNKAKNRRRVNRMHKRALGRKLKRNG